ncbi:MAG: DUF4296 domain-containing protein [Bacteroidales bacterium]|nr:DUF4296 domain-containing protein [Bacteroidales bacterium]
MTRKKLISIAILVSVVIIAIASYNTYRNRLIPSKERMAQILSDIYIADAVVQHKTKDKGKEKVIEHIYKSVLSHYDLTKPQFDSIIAWYSEHPEKYSEVYFEVVALLSEREARFGRVLQMRDSVSSLIERMRDSLTVNFWRYGKEVIRLPFTEKDTIPKNLVFDVDVDSLRGGKVTLEMTYMFPHKNESRDSCYMQLVAFYNDTIADTSKCIITRKTIRQTATLEQQLRDTLEATKITATLLTSKELKKTTANLSAIKFQYIPYEITDSVTFDEIQLPPIFSY